MSIGPSYQLVADDICAQITSGRLAVGKPIPSTRELMARYKVSSTVARHAVEVLKDAGVLDGHPGKGVYVKALPEQAAAERADAQALAKEVAEFRDEVDERFAEIYRRMGWDEHSQEGQDDEQRHNGRRQPRAAGGLQA
jgi:DNA-binding GntR family transcriptional regulator